MCMTQVRFPLKINAIIGGCVVDISGQGTGCRDLPIYSVWYIRKWCRASSSCKCGDLRHHPIILPDKTPPGAMRAAVCRSRCNALRLRAGKSKQLPYSPPATGSRNFSFSVVSRLLPLIIKNRTVAIGRVLVSLLTSNADQSDRSQKGFCEETWHSQISLSWNQHWPSTYIK